MSNVNEKGLRAARQYAQWYIGDPSWANNIIDAYLNPDEAMENLRAEKAHHDV